MRNKILPFLKSEGKYLLASFFIPVMIMVIIYFNLDIYWGSDLTVLASDAFSQFSNFHASFNNMLHGKQSLFYTWNASLGLNYYALISYYLGGLFTPLVFFFDNSQIPDVLYLLTLLKIGAAGLSFWVYARNTFHIPKWSHVALSVAYALMSFVTVHSELIMWLDTFLFLPLVILGIDRLMDKNKPICLFVSYLLLFISNFYMGFITGLFSVLYYIARMLPSFKQYRKTIVPYLLTSFTAGISSFIMVLPTVLDLRNNGEALTQVTEFKTEATAFWDIIMKNMIGVFDTTKYGSIPFIYIGLFPLVLCIYYFVHRKIPFDNKIAYGSVFGILIFSFYFTPLNLFWHGMHAPNMFLFRYSFVFSFLVIMLAGYAWEKLTPNDLGVLAGTIIVLMAVFTLAHSLSKPGTYTYIDDESFYLTIIFLFFYLVSIILYQTKHIPGKRLALFILLLMCVEATINTNSMLNGIKEDWNYPSRNLYAKPYAKYKDIIDRAQSQDDTFYRLETLDPISANDNLNYGFSGISLFSSIRNRNSSGYLDTLGFRSRGTNLNIRYPNNTLLMDALFSIKYNIAVGNPLKYSFAPTLKNSSYTLYENQRVLPAGILTDSTLYNLAFPANDNLGCQTKLYNKLANSSFKYFTYIKPEMTASKNTEVITEGANVIYKEKTPNLAKEITWEVTVPAGKQAYLSLFPADFSLLDGSSASLTVNDQTFKHQIDITGQYYNLGYYTEPTTLSFTVSFYGSPKVSFIDPPVILLDLPAFREATKRIQENGVEFKMTGRKATADVTIHEDKQVLLTSIPYDKGWKAYVDGKETAIKPFKDAMVAIEVPKGKHTVKFSFLPQGFRLGVFCFFAGILIFTLYVKREWLLSKFRTSDPLAEPDFLEE